MPAPCLSPIYACAIRITRLFEDGEPDFGADAYSVHVPVSVTETVTTFDTAPIQQTNGCGNICVNVPGRSTITGYEIVPTFCEDDFELWAAITGGTTAASGGNIIAWAMPDPSVPPPPVCVEVWQQTRLGDNIGTINGVQQYKSIVYPYVTFVQADRTMENSNTLLPWTGTTSVNNQIGATGPYGDWPMAANGPKMEYYTATLPTEFCGMTSLAS